MADPAAYLVHRNQLWSSSGGGGRQSQKERAGQADWMIDQAVARGALTQEAAEDARQINPYTWWDKAWGYKDPSSEMMGTWSQPFFDTLLTTNYAMKAVSTGVLESQPWKGNAVQVGPFKLGFSTEAFKRSFQDRESFMHMVERHSDWGPKMSFALGLGMDIGLDPLTYMTFGVSTGAKVALNAGTKIGGKVLKKGSTKTINRHGEEIYHIAARRFEPLIKARLINQNVNLSRLGKTELKALDAQGKLMMHNEIGQYMVNNYDSLAMELHRSRSALKRWLTPSAKSEWAGQLTRNMDEFFFGGKEVLRRTAADMFEETASVLHKQRGLTPGVGKYAGAALGAGIAGSLTEEWTDNSFFGAIGAVGGGMLGLKIAKSAMGPSGLAKSFDRQAGVPIDISDEWFKHKGQVSQHIDTVRKDIEANLGHLDENQRRSISHLLEAGERALILGEDETIIGAMYGIDKHTGKLASEGKEATAKLTKEQWEARRRIQAELAVEQPKPPTTTMQGKDISPSPPVDPSRIGKGGDITWERDVPVYNSAGEVVDRVYHGNPKVATALNEFSGHMIHRRSFLSESDRARQSPKMDFEEAVWEWAWESGAPATAPKKKWMEVLADEFGMDLQKYWDDAQSARDRHPSVIVGKGKDIKWGDARPGDLRAQNMLEQAMRARGTWAHKTTPKEDLIREIWRQSEEVPEGADFDDWFDYAEYAKGAMFWVEDLAKEFDINIQDAWQNARLSTSPVRFSLQTPEQKGSDAFIRLHEHLTEREFFKVREKEIMSKGYGWEGTGIIPKSVYDSKPFPGDEVSTRYILEEFEEIFGRWEMGLADSEGLIFRADDAWAVTGNDALSRQFPPSNALDATINSVAKRIGQDSQDISAIVEHGIIEQAAAYLFRGGLWKNAELEDLYKSEKMTLATEAQQDAKIRKLAQRLFDEEFEKAKSRLTSLTGEQRHTQFQQLGINFKPRGEPGTRRFPFQTKTGKIVNDWFDEFELFVKENGHDGNAIARKLAGVDGQEDAFTGAFEREIMKMLLPSLPKNLRVGISDVPLIKDDEFYAWYASYGGMINLKRPPARQYGDNFSDPGAFNHKTILHEYIHAGTSNKVNSGERLIRGLEYDKKLLKNPLVKSTLELKKLLVTIQDAHSEMGRRRGAWKEDLARMGTPSRTAAHARGSWYGKTLSKDPIPWHKEHEVSHAWHLDDRVTAKEMDAFMYEGERTHMLSNIDELLAAALSSRAAQKWLDSIVLSDSGVSGWTHMVRHIYNLLGKAHLGPGFKSKQTAFSEVLRISDELIQDPTKSFVRTKTGSEITDYHLPTWSEGGTAAEGVFTKLSREEIKFFADYMKWWKAGKTGPSDIFTEGSYYDPTNKYWNVQVSGIGLRGTSIFHSFLEDLPRGSYPGDIPISLQFDHVKGEVPSILTRINEDPDLMGHMKMRPWMEGVGSARFAPPTPPTPTTKPPLMERLRRRKAPRVEDPNRIYASPEVVEGLKWARAKFDEIASREVGEGYAIETLKDYVYHAYKTPGMRKFALNRARQEGTSIGMGRNGFMLHRKIATIEEAFEKYGPGSIEDDIAKIVARREGASIKMIEHGKFRDYIKNTNMAALMKYDSSLEGAKQASALKKLLKHAGHKDAHTIEYDQTWSAPKSVATKLGLRDASAHTVGSTAMRSSEKTNLGIIKLLAQDISDRVGRGQLSEAASSFRKIKRTFKLDKEGREFDVVHFLDEYSDGSNDYMMGIAQMLGKHETDIDLRDIQRIINKIDDWARREVSTPLPELFPSMLDDVKKSMLVDKRWVVKKGKRKGQLLKGVEKKMNEFEARIKAKNEGVIEVGKPEPQLPEGVVLTAKALRMRYGDYSDLAPASPEEVKRLVSAASHHGIKGSNLNDLVSYRVGHGNISQMTAREVEEMNNFIRGYDPGFRPDISASPFGEPIVKVTFSEDRRLPYIENVDVALAKQVRREEDDLLGTIRKVKESFVDARIAKAEARIERMTGELRPDTGGASYDEGVARINALKEDLADLRAKKSTIMEEPKPAMPKRDRTIFRDKTVLLSMNSDVLSRKESAWLGKKHGFRRESFNLTKLFGRKGKESIMARIRSEKNRIKAIKDEAAEINKQETAKIKADADLGKLRKKPSQTEEEWTKELAEIADFEKRMKDAGVDVIPSAHAERRAKAIEDYWIRRDSEEVQQASRRADARERKLHAKLASIKSRLENTRVELLGDGKYRIKASGQVRDIIVKGKGNPEIMGRNAEAIREAVISDAILNSTKKQGLKTEFWVPMHVRDIPSKVTGGAREYYLPESVGNLLKEIDTPFYNPENAKWINQILRGYDFLQNTFKIHVLALFGSTWMRNAVGNATLAYTKAGLSMFHPETVKDFAKMYHYAVLMESPRARSLAGIKGVNDPKLIRLGKETIKAAGDESGGGARTIAQLHPELAQRGIFTGHFRNEIFASELPGAAGRVSGAVSGGLMGGAMGGPTGALLGTAVGGLIGRQAYTMRPVFKLGELATELPTRLILGLTEYKKTGSLEVAGRSVRNYLHDYSELSIFEKRFMRRMIPFYNFSKMAIRSTARGAIEHPSRLALPYKAFTDQNILSDVLPEDIPDWYHHQLVGLMKEYDEEDGQWKSWVFSGLMSPAEEAANLVDIIAPGGQSALKMGARGPFAVTSLLELGANFDTFRLSRIYPDVKEGIYKTKFQSAKPFKDSPDWMKALVKYDAVTDTVSPKMAWLLGEVQFSRFIKIGQQLHNSDGVQIAGMNFNALSRAVLGLSIHKFDANTQRYWTNKAKIDAMENVLANIGYMKVKGSPYVNPRLKKPGRKNSTQYKTVPVLK